MTNENNNLGLTVNDLKRFCEYQIEKGNGHKHIIISCDNEANGFHTLFYQFMDSDDEEFEELLALEHDGTHTKDNCVILG